MPKSKISNNGYYELKTDLFSHIKLERRQLNYDMPMHFHRNLEFQYIESGCYRTVVDNKEYVFEKDEMVFIPYCLQHMADASDTQSILFIIPHAIIQDFTSFFRHRTLNIELKDRKFNREFILPVMELILAAPSQLNNPIVAKGYVNVIFGLLTQHYGYVKYENFSNPNFLLDLIQYIDQHSNENLTLDRLAEQFGYNKFYLSRIFNKTLGASLTDYVNQVRVQKFVKQYRDGWEGNIADLAFSCGFESIPSFYRTFSRVFSMTPKEYFELEKEIFW